MLAYFIQIRFSSDPARGIATNGRFQLSGYYAKRANAKRISNKNWVAISIANQVRQLALIRESFFSFGGIAGFGIV